MQGSRHVSQESQQHTPLLSIFVSSQRMYRCATSSLSNYCLGGLVSNHDVDNVVQEFFKWIDLAVKLPRLSIMDKFRYALEVMLKEACVYLLCEVSRLFGNNELFVEA